MSGSCKENSHKHSFQLSSVEKEDKIQQLRRALADCKVCCKRYIGADDEKLLRILRVNSFDVENAAEAIERTELYKSKYPEIFSVPAEQYKKCFEKNILTNFRESDKEGRTVICIKIKNWYPAEISLEALIKATTYLAEEVLYKEEAQTNGMVGILDFNEVGFFQLTQILSTISFRVAKMGNDWMKGAVIIKVKTVFFLNTPFAVNQVWKAMKVMVSKNVRDRIHFSDLTSKEFTSNFRSEHLPISLNGQLSEEDAIDLDIMKSICEI